MKNDEKTYYAYMVRCADGTIYSGYTTEPRRRIAVHNRGLGAKYTRSRLPVKLVYIKSFPTKRDALKQEAALKKLSHADKITLIEESAPFGDGFNFSSGTPS